MSLNYFKKAAVFAAPLLVAALAQGQASPWAALSNAAPSPAGTMLLLTDGRVMAQEAGCTNAWMILTPSSNGNYATGTWSTTAVMGTSRLYFASTVLPSGKVWVLGGEYSSVSGCGADWINTGEIYDPVANTWTAITNYPNGSFGDDPSELLPGGNIIAGDIGSPTPHIYNIATNTWSTAGTKVYNDQSDEEGWAKLPNGNFIAYDIFESIGTGVGHSEEYNPGTNSWSSITPGVNGTTGTLPLLSSGALGEELGPLMRLLDGRILVIGANQHTALYNPTANSWAAGPDTLGPSVGNCASNCAFGADDAPAALLPTGHVIFAADAGPTSGTFAAPTYLFDFNPVAGTTTLMSPQPPDAAQLAVDPAFICRTLMLPTGQLLFSDGATQTLYIYTPSSTLAAPPYRPVVQGVTFNSGVFTLTGLQLNGQSAGAYYGDDVVTDENYPIVRIMTPNGATTYYAKTTNWSSVAVGSVGQETVNFTLPDCVPSGNYSLIVSGAGIQGVPFAINIAASSCGTNQ